MKRHRIPGTTSRPRTLYMLPSIPDSESTAIKNGLALRTAASTSGVCRGCGARGRLIGPDTNGIFHLWFEHENDCAALVDGEAA